MKKRVLYAEASYEAIVEENGYFVDKTEYIAKLELVNNTVFLRPRRFGKSLLCTTLECYYDIRRKDRFEELFGHTWIGRNPTPLHNSCFVLHLDFSVQTSWFLHPTARAGTALGGPLGEWGERFFAPTCSGPSGARMRCEVRGAR